jgi:hypothetical protein
LLGGAGIKLGAIKNEIIATNTQLHNSV